MFLSLFLCLLAILHKNFWMDLDEIFREGWQWAEEQVIKFLWWSDHGYDPNLDPNTDKTCLGGGMHCPSACSIHIISLLPISLLLLYMTKNTNVNQLPVSSRCKTIVFLQWLPKNATNHKSQSALQPLTSIITSSSQMVGSVSVSIWFSPSCAE